MGAPYTSVTVSNYNANPPSDDGAQTSANRIRWSTDKTKLTDPLKTAIESINTNVGTAIGKVIGGAGVTTTALTYGVGASDQGKLVNATAAGITITTPDATDVTSPFVFGLLNSSSGDITLDGSGSQTVNGSLTLTVKSGDGYIIFTDGSNWFVVGRKTGILPRGYIDGCTISNGTDATNDIDVAVGVCRDSTNTVDITVAAMAGKQLDANWAPGAGAGMRDSSQGIGDHTYHIYAVAKADGTQDIYAHTSAVVATVIAALQAETGGAAYLYARRIASIIRESSSIIAFTQDGDFFQRGSTAADVTASNPGTSAVTRTLSVPTGIRVKACMMFMASNSGTGGNTLGLISDLSLSDEAPGTALTQISLAKAGSGGVATAASQVECWTNTSAQVRHRISFSDASVSTQIRTQGWRDSRGKG